MTKSVVHVSSVDQIPLQDHWAIIVDSSTDDGYGGRRPCVSDYVAYLDRVDWQMAVREAWRSQRRFRALFVRSADVSVKVEVVPFATPEGSTP